MKKLYLLPLVLVGCIRTDLEDPLTPTLRIDNAVSEIEFRVSGTYPLSAIYTDDTGEPAEVQISWVSSDDKILSLNEKGLATANAEGTATITASYDGLEDTEVIEVLASREMISISGLSTIRVGNSVLFTANYLDLNGQTTTMSPEWSSSNKTIATVDEGGRVTAVAEGMVDITASFGNASSTVTIKVVNESVMMDPEIQITKFASFMEVGEQFTFEASYINTSGVVDGMAAITWSSSSPAVLSIDKNDGAATANAEGTATITAAYQSISSTVDVTVEASAVTERSGSLMGTGYSIEGDFVLSKNEDGDVILTITNYKPDGPGPFFYLSNINEQKRVDGINLGKAKTRGNITINVSDIDSNVELFTYNYLIVWCDPFNTRLGFGEFNN
ncbi:MAG: Ig-like domain-containing protein [Ekhidna sp.]|nr:Ig-like domain-containing protein [Ekhidna sp.]